MHEEIQVEANNQGEQNSVQMASADGSGKPADINVGWHLTRVRS